MELVVREVHHTHNEGCEQGRYIRIEQTAEYLCPQCGLVHQNSYRGEMADPNLFLIREDAKRWRDDLPPDAPAAAGPRPRGFRIPPDNDDESATRLLTVITPKAPLQKHRQPDHIADEPEPQSSPLTTGSTGVGSPSPTMIPLTALTWFGQYR